MFVQLPEDEIRRAKNFVRVFKNQVIRIAASEMLWIATYLRVKLVQRLWNQDFRHRPLSAAYLAKKKREGLDTRILIATHAYIDSIHVEDVTATSGARKGEIVAYAVRPGKGIHPPSGLPFMAIARIHEFGSFRAKVPARPHWRPVWQAFLREGGNLYVQRVKAKLKR